MSISIATKKLVLTVLMFVGVALALVPYCSGRLGHFGVFVTAGLMLAFGAGFARCAVAECGCADREPYHTNL